MNYVLVVSQDNDYRRLLVANLVLRSYVAVGVASVTESDPLLHSALPGVIVLYGSAADCEPELAQLNTERLAPVPVVLIGPDMADIPPAAQANVAACLDDSIDLKHLIELLRPWLPERQPYEVRTAVNQIQQ